MESLRKDLIKKKTKLAEIDLKESENSLKKNRSEKTRSLGAGNRGNASDLSKNGGKLGGKDGGGDLGDIYVAFPDLMNITLRSCGGVGGDRGGSMVEGKSLVEVQSVENFFDLKTRVSGGMREGKTVRLDFESLIGDGGRRSVSELREKIMVNVKQKEGNGFWQTFDFRNIKDMMNISVNELRKDPKMVKISFFPPKNKT